MELVGLVAAPQPSPSDRGQKPRHCAVECSTILTAGAGRVVKSQLSCAGSCYGRVHSSYMLKGVCMLDLQLPARHDWAVHERATASWSWSLSSSGSPSRFGDGLAAGIAERQVALSTARVLTSQRLDEHPLALVVSNAVAGFQVELRRLLLRARGQLLALDHRRPATWAMAPAHLQRRQRAQLRSVIDATLQEGDVALAHGESASAVLQFDGDAASLGTAFFVVRVTDEVERDWTAKVPLAIPK